MVKDISQLTRDEITALAEADYAAVPKLREHGAAWGEAARLALHVQSALESRMSQRLGTSDTAAVRSLLKQIGGTGKSAVSLASAAERRATTLGSTADEAERLKTAVDRLTGEAAAASDSHAADPDIAFQGYNGISDPDAGYQAYLSDVTEDLRSEVRLSSEAYEGQAREHHDAPVVDFAGPGEWTGPMPDRMPQPVPMGDNVSGQPGKSPLGGGTGGYSGGDGGYSGSDGSRPIGSPVGGNSVSTSMEPELQSGPSPVTTSPVTGGPSPVPSGGGTIPGPGPVPGTGPLPGTAPNPARPVTPPATGRPTPGGNPPATGIRPTPGLPGTGPRPNVPGGTTPTTPAPGTRPTTGMPPGMRPNSTGPHTPVTTGGRPATGQPPMGAGNRPATVPAGTTPTGGRPVSGAPSTGPGANPATTGRPASTMPTTANPRPGVTGQPGSPAPSSPGGPRGAAPVTGSKAERALLPNQRGTAATGGPGSHNPAAAPQRPSGTANPGRAGSGGLAPTRSTVPPVLGGRGTGTVPGGRSAAPRPELNRGSLTGLRSGRPASRTGKPRTATSTAAAGKVIGSRSKQGATSGADNPDRDALRLRAELRRRFLNEIDDRKALTANDSELLRGIEATVVPGVITSSPGRGPVRRGQIGRVFGPRGWQG